MELERHRRGERTWGGKIVFYFKSNGNPTVIGFPRQRRIRSRNKNSTGVVGKETRKSD